MKKLLLVVVGCVFAVMPAFAQTAGWMNPAWIYRSPVVVNNPNGATLTQFQVNIRLGSETDFTKLQPNGADLRVTAADGVTQLPFWIESFNASSSTASIWVKIPSIPASGTTLYIYYGNPAATSASNGNNVFLFFDDFESQTGQKPGYFALSSPTTALVQSQEWEPTPPHTLSIVEMNQGGYKYWGYYGLYADCGGVGLAYSNDLMTWTKNPNNPLFTNGRWPSVQVVNGTIYMIYGKNYCSNSYIELATSTDGIHFTDQATIVPAQSGLRNQNPNLFFNPNNNRWYLYYYHGDDSSNFQVRVRSATTILGLASASNTVVLQNVGKTAAPTMFYYNGVYYLSVEATDPTTAWVTNIYSSSSPTSGFTLLPGNPVLQNGGACMFQQQFGTTLHNFYCQQTNGVWTLQQRTANLAAGPQQYGVLDPSKWTASGGGTWAIVPDTQADGSTGHVAQGQTTGRQILVTPNLNATAYVVQAEEKLVLGTVWGLGVQATAFSNQYSINLYEGMDSSYNIFSYGWFNNTGPQANTQVLQLEAGALPPEVWSKLVAKVHDNTIEVTENGQTAQGTNATLTSGGVALYGEQGTNAEWDNVLVRKYAMVDPSATVETPTSSGIGSVTLSPSSVLGGASAQGTVTLDTAAPAGGVQVGLSSDNSAALVPTSVVVAQGQTAATFNVTTTAVTAITTANISATFGSTGLSAVLTIYPYISSLSVSPASVQGGASIQGTVSLHAAAPAGGAVISLSSGSPLASVPATMTIPAGQTSGSFTITTSPVNTNTVVTITAGYGGASQSTTITLTPALSSLTLNPVAVLAGGSSQGVVTLGGPAPTGGAAVLLTSGNAVATVPVSVNVPANATSATFPITTTGTGVTVQVAIGASYLGASQSATLTVQRVLASLSLAQSQVNGGATVQGSVALTAAAPTGGEVVSLSSDNGAASVPTSVTVAAGATSANFTVTTSSVAATTTANITASSFGSSQTVPLTLAPAQSGWLGAPWQYRSTVTITNPGGVALANFQVKVQLGSSFNFAQAAAAGADIRFTGPDGVTLLPFWIESWNATTSSATLWVKVPSIPAGGTSLYMYYGNPSATNVSNGTATFDFFDDFSEASLDTTRWTSTGGTWSIVQDTNQNGVSGGALRGTTTGRQILYSTYSGTDYVLDAWGKQVSGRVWGLGVRATNGANLDSINLYSDLDYGSNLYVYSWINAPGANATGTLGQVPVGVVNTNTWYHLTAKVHGTAIDILKDGAPVLSVTNSSLPSGGVALYGEPGTVAEWNDVLVRKYAATEPVASLGVPTPPSSGARVARVCLSQMEVNGGPGAPATCTLPSGTSIPAGHGVVVLVSFPSTATLAANALTDTRGNTYQLRASQIDPATADELWMWSSTLTSSLNAGDILTLVPPSFWGAWNLYVYDIGPVSGPDTAVGTPLYYTNSWTLGPTPATVGARDVCIGAAGVNQGPTPPLADYSVTNGFTLLDVTNFHNTGSSNYPGKNVVTMWGEASAGTAVSTTLSSTAGPDTGPSVLGCFTEQQ